MPKFSERSSIKLSTCHPDLQKLFNEVIKTFDCTIVWGHRGRSPQNVAFDSGASQKRWPDSEHNKLPSTAADVGPWVPGKGLSTNKEQCYFFAGYVLAVADRLGIHIRLGADWDSDKDIQDQTFDDLWHFELK